MSELMKKLKENRQHLTKQQVRTIRGQILAGDLVGAEKGLNKLLKGVADETHCIM